MVSSFYAVRFGPGRRPWWWPIDTPTRAAVSVQNLDGAVRVEVTGLGDREWAARHELVDERERQRNYHRCPVCLARLRTRAHYDDDGRLVFASDECRCQYYYYQFRDGAYEERIGYVHDQWGEQDAAADDWITRRHARRRALVNEARRLLDEPEILELHCQWWVGVESGVPGFPEYDQTARLILADWLRDHNFPLNEEAVRGRDD